MKISTSIAECIGLWIAEGDRKTKHEITFTNSEWSLIEFFYFTIIKRFKGNPRVYVYNKKLNDMQVSLENCLIKYYIDSRASRPYFILRLASVEAIKKWKEVTTAVEPKHYAGILRGFFAGEGNIKTGSHSNRAIRLAQKEPIDLINNCLTYHKITWKFSKKDRAYCITGIWNWKIMKKLSLAKLHKEKQKAFISTFNSFKETHYPNGYIIQRLLKILSKPYRTKNLAKILARSEARIYDSLSDLNRLGIVKKYKVRSKNYWILSKEEVIIISKLKQKYLQTLEGKRTAEIGRIFKVSWKSAYNRLKELEKLNLIKQEGDIWKKVNTQKKIIVR